MKSQRGFAKAIVTAKAEKALNEGHPWVYDTEVVSIEGAFENGGLLDVVSQKGRYLGTGFISEKSKIRIRIISKNANDKFDRDFWKRRLSHAVMYRKTVMGPEDIKCCRLIFGEADFFPGLTVDRFNDVLSVQILSLCMDKLKFLLIPLLLDILREDGQHIRGVYERNDVGIRLLEGLTEYKGWFWQEEGNVRFGETFTEIIENGVKYVVDFENGQKTGFFLDQKYNRLAVSKIAAGKNVLDCFTHTGSFALNAARGGALHVTAVDVSETAVAMARKNAQLNGLSEKMSFVTEDVFDLLPKLEGERGKYDFIILDPPAFTKSRKTVESAMRGYKEINLRAMKLLPRGGYLATCSCSHFFEEELFKRMLRSAARDAGVELRQIEARQQSPDHPILWNVGETNYLKFYIFQVV